VVLTERERERERERAYAAAARKKLAHGDKQQIPTGTQEYAVRILSFVFESHTLAAWLQRDAEHLQHSPYIRMAQQKNG
jgi:hypothetical protein